MPTEPVGNPGTFDESLRAGRAGDAQDLAEINAAWLDLPADARRCVLHVVRSYRGRSLDSGNADG